MQDASFSSSGGCGGVGGGGGGCCGSGGGGGGFGRSGAGSEVAVLELGIFKAIAADMLAPTQRDNVEWGHNCAQHGDAGNASK